DRTRREAEQAARRCSRPRRWSAAGWRPGAAGATPAWDRSSRWEGTVGWVRPPWWRRSLPREAERRRRRKEKEVGAERPGRRTSWADWFPAPDFQRSSPGRTR